MKQKMVTRIIGLIMVMSALTILSCTKGTDGINGKSGEPPKMEKMVKLYPNNFGESKKIVVAKVNGVGITMRDLIDKMNQTAPKYVKDAGQQTPETDKKIKQEALDILVFRELAFQEAVRQGLKADPGTLEAALEKFKAASGSEKAYRENLEKSGLDDTSLRKIIEMDILIEAIFSKEILQKVNANDVDAIEKRKKEWEEGLKKKAKIEILPAEGPKVTN